MSVFRSSLLGDGGRPRAPPAAGAFCTFFFGAALPGARLGLALLVFAALFAAPTAAQAQTEVTLTSNLNKARHNGPFVGPLSSGGENTLAQRFTTGSNEYGYTLSSVELKLEAVLAGAVPSVSIHGSAGRNPAANALFVLTNPSRIADGTRKFNAPANTKLEKGTDYFVVIGSSGARYGIEVTTDTSQSGADGWSIQDSYRSDGGTGWGFHSGESVKLRIKGTIDGPPNTAATGKPGIDGTPRVGQTLTATAGNMADDNDLPATVFPAGYSFQWVQVDGTTETGIGGATSGTYVPVTGDVGKTLKVKVTFTDGDGYEETLTSDATRAVAPAAAPIIPTLDSAEAFFANGALRYRFDLRLSEGVSIPYREMRDHAFSVTNGRMDGAKRIHKERIGGKLYSNHWRMTAAPADETKPVTVTLRGNRPCGERGALCTGSGGWLDGSPSLTLSADTEPPDLGSLPSLSIADTSGTEDSANLAFDVRLSKAVSATIAVDFRTVPGGTATADADYREASHRIVFAAGETVQPGSVALIEDAADDAGETVNVEIANARVITPRGAEFGPLPITRGQATGTIDAPAATKTPLPDVDMRIENTTGSESGGWLHFTIRLSRALDENVCYGFETLGTGSATEGVDYLRRPKSTSWQPAGVTEWTEFVRILDDSIDDGGETVKVRISDAELCSDASKTITISREEATGTIINSDPIPAAWLARFGRTVADQVIGAVEGRMEAARAPGAEVSLAGQRVGGSGVQAGRAPEEARVHGGGLAAFDAEGRNRRVLRGRGMTGRELLLGSSFSLAAGDGRTGGYALWGRGSVSRFDGREGGLAVDGEVASALLGADWSRERTTAGLILGHSIGDGGYRSESGRGTVSSTLTGLYPWMRRALGERISLWGVAGYGEGTLTVTPANADPARPGRRSAPAWGLRWARRACAAHWCRRRRAAAWRLRSRPTRWGRARARRRSRGLRARAPG